MPNIEKNKANKTGSRHELCSPNVDACKAPLMLMHKGEQFLHRSSRVAIYPRRFAILPVSSMGFDIMYVERQALP
jgi:hypothetical protein